MSGHGHNYRPRVLCLYLQWGKPDGIGKYPKVSLHNFNNYDKFWGHMFYSKKHGRHILNRFSIETFY